MKNNSPEFVKKKIKLLIKFQSILKESLELLDLRQSNNFTNQDIAAELCQANTFLKTLNTKIDLLYLRKINNTDTPLCLFKIESTHLQEAWNQVREDLDDIALGFDAFANNAPEVYSSHKICIRAYNMIFECIEKIEMELICLIRNFKQNEPAFKKVKRLKLHFLEQLEKVKQERKNCLLIIELKDATLRRLKLDNLNNEVSEIAIKAQNELKFHLSSVNYYELLN